MGVKNFERHRHLMNVSLRQLRYDNKVYKTLAEYICRLTEKFVLAYEAFMFLRF